MRGQTEAVDTSGLPAWPADAVGGTALPLAASGDEAALARALAAVHGVASLVQVIGAARAARATCAERTADEARRLVWASLAAEAVALVESGTAPAETDRGTSG